MSAALAIVANPFKPAPYGETLTPNVANDTLKRVAGQAELYYYRARYYDPEQGRPLPWPFPSQIVSQERFVGSAHRLQSLQTDPIGTEDQMNLYNYVGNDPLNGTDPTGRQGEGLFKRWFNFGSEKYIRQANTSTTNAATAQGMDRINPMRSQRVANDQLAAVAVTSAEGMANGLVNTAILAATVAGPGDEVAGMAATQISEALAIPPSNSFRVIEFPSAGQAIASPINRTNPGFVGRGRTAGGAREFVVPNQPIPKDANIRVVQ